MKELSMPFSSINIISPLSNSLAILWELFFKEKFSEEAMYPNSVLIIALIYYSLLNPVS